MKASDGSLFFGTVKGFSTFSPYTIQLNRVVPRVFITALTVLNQPQRVGSKLLPEALGDIRQLDLGYKDNMFTLTFSALSYCAPERNRFAYRLDGFDNNWIKACIRNMIAMRRRLMQRFAATPTDPVPELAKAPMDNALLRQMNEIIEENIDNPDFNVQMLVERLNISRSGLFAKVKAITDTTPNEMIQIIRLRKAARLLKTKQYRVSEVAYQVGFNNPSYFSKCFQKQFGVKPGEY